MECWLEYLGGDAAPDGDAADDTNARNELVAIVKAYHRVFGRAPDDAEMQNGTTLDARRVNALYLLAVGMREKASRRGIALGAYLASQSRVGSADREMQLTMLRTMLRQHLYKCLQLEPKQVAKFEAVMTESGFSDWETTVAWVDDIPVQSQLRVGLDAARSAGLTDGDFVDHLTSEVIRRQLGVETF